MLDVSFIERCSGPVLPLPAACSGCGHYYHDVTFVCRKVWLSLLLGTVIGVRVLAQYEVLLLINSGAKIRSNIFVGDHALL